MIYDTIDDAVCVLVCARAIAVSARVEEFELESPTIKSVVNGVTLAESIERIIVDNFFLELRFRVF